MKALLTVQQVRRPIWSGLISLGLAGSWVLVAFAADRHRPGHFGHTPASTTSTAPYVPPDPKKAPEVVKAAIANLNKEVAANRKDPKAPLREKCNYFLENKSTDLMPEEIVAVMGRSLGQDAAADVYIKWQLLSGIQGKVDPKLAPKLAAAYRAAPAPFMRPGLDQADKRLLDRALRGATEGDAGKITSELEKKVNEVARSSAPFLTYRDELYLRLPVSGEVIMAALDDSVTRANLGIDAGAHTKSAVSEVTTWSVSASPQDVQSVASLLRTLVARMSPGPGKGARASFPPSYYSSVEFDPKAKHLMWKEADAKFIDPKILNATIAQLDEVATTLANMKSK